MRGTMISTPSGAKPVEMLEPGDIVSTVDDRALPVAWIGRQTISTKFADPLRVLPVRIKANALADGMPSRDLLLSPDHAILLHDVLIQAGALVNGGSIVRQVDVPEIFTYYHIELDEHSLILAENTPAETFIDNVDRVAFDNWDEHETLYPEGRIINEMPYPRAKAYRQVPRMVRERLAERGSGLKTAAA
jgi:Hint domain